MREKLRKRSNTEESVLSHRFRNNNTVRQKTLRSQKMDDQGNNALHLELINRKNPSKVKNFLKYQQNLVESFNDSGEKPIDIAIRDKSFENVLNILKSSERVSLRVFDRLMKYSKDETSKILQTLHSIENFEYIFSFSFIKNFIDEENIEVIKVLYENGHFTNFMLNENGQNFLHYFVTEDKPKLNGFILEFLLDCLPLNQRDDFGKTPFAYALESKKELYVQLFLNKFEVKGTDLIIDEEIKKLMNDQEIIGRFGRETKDRIKFVLERVEKNITVKLQERENFYGNFYGIILKNDVVNINKMLKENSTNPEIIEQLLKMNIDKSLVLRNVLINGPLRSVIICLEKNCRLKQEHVNGLVVNESLLTEKEKNGKNLLFYLTYFEYVELYHFICDQARPISKKVSVENFHHQNILQVKNRSNFEKDFGESLDLPLLEAGPQLSTLKDENNFLKKLQAKGELKSFSEKICEIDEEEYVLKLYQRAAASNDHKQIAKLFNKYKTTPKIIEEILKADLDPISKISTFFCAVKDGPLESVKIVLKHDIPIKKETFEIAVAINSNIVNEVDKEGKSLVFHLVNSQYSDFAKILMKRRILSNEGMNPDHRNIINLGEKIKKIFALIDYNWPKIVKLVAQGQEEKTEEKLGGFGEKADLDFDFGVSGSKPNITPRVNNNREKGNNR